MKFILLFVKIGKFIRLRGHRPIRRGRTDDMSLNFPLRRKASLKTVIMYVNFSLGEARCLCLSSVAARKAKLWGTG